MTIKHSTKRATVEVEEVFQDVLQQVLKTVAPNAQAIMDQELKRIEKEAIQDWPRRKPVSRTDETGRTTYFRDNSRESWKKFRRGAKILPGGQFSVFLRNTAPYSYYIKYGVDSENNRRQDILQPQGRNVASETLIKPHRKTANKVVKALSDDLIKRV
tara:strand:+ start:2220 stop:2693 length:474 start_codon:yes stop_codon:yes gene_type:complete